MLTNALNSRVFAYRRLSVSILLEVSSACVHVASNWTQLALSVSTTMSV